VTGGSRAREGTRTQLNVRLDATDTARLAVLAKHYGVGEAAIVRMLVKRETDVIVRMKRSESEQLRGTIDAATKRLAQLDAEQAPLAGKSDP
jgi:hypothetical protein